MDLEWNPLTIPALLLGPVSFWAAWAVYRARPGALRNQAIAITIFAGGIAQFVGYGIRPLILDPGPAIVLHRSFVVISLIGYTGFHIAATTFSGRIARIFSGWQGRTFILVGSGYVVLANMLNPRTYVSEYQYSEVVGSWGGTGGGSLFLPYIGWMTIGMVAVAWGALRNALVASSPLLRTQNRWIFLGAIASVLGIAVPLLIIGVVGFAPTWVLQLNFVGLPLGTLIYSLMAAYAFTKAEHVEGEVRAQRFLRRSTLAAIGVPLAVIVFQVGSEVASETIGIGLTAVVMTMMLAFAVPLQRWVDKVTENVAPGSDDQATYWPQRKMRIFEAALEGALRDGRITAREKDMLLNLQLELGISNDEAAAAQARLQT